MAWLKGTKGSDMTTLLSLSSRGIIVGKALTIAFFMIFVQSCSSVPETKEAPNTVVLKYSDFGPQSVSWETIGMGWWQWDDCGDPNPNYSYDIRVVVYRGIPLEDVKQLYPVRKEKNQDYRYLEYQKAVEYLNKGIQKYSSREWEDLKEIADGLRRTRTRLFEALGEPHDLPSGRPSD